jgi:hypothetical protein
MTKAHVSGDLRQGNLTAPAPDIRVTSASRFLSGVQTAAIRDDRAQWIFAEMAAHPSLGSRGAV